MDVEADAAVGDNLQALGLHLLNAPVDDPLFQLEVWNAVSEQSAHAIRSLVERDRMSGARELLRAGQPRRSRAYDRNALSRLARGRLRHDPFFSPGVIDDVLLDQLDRDRIVVDAEDAGFFAGRGANSAGELRKIVGRVQPVDRLAPAAAVDEIVPVGDDVPERATLVAEGNAAIHAAGTLRAQFVFGHLEIEFAPILQALPDRTPRRSLALDLHEARNLAHRSRDLPSQVNSD